jgi:hypothetical protein
LQQLLRALYRFIINPLLTTISPSCHLIFVSRSVFPWLVVMHISTMHIFYNVLFGLKPLLNLILAAYLNLFQIKVCPKFYCRNFGFLVAGVHICRAFFLQFYDISLQNDIRTPRASIEETFSLNLINRLPVFGNAGSPR